MTPFDSIDRDEVTGLLLKRARSIGLFPDGIREQDFLNAFVVRCIKDRHIAAADLPQDTGETVSFDERKVMIKAGATSRFAPVKVYKLDETGKAVEVAVANKNRRYEVIEQLRSSMPILEKIYPLMGKDEAAINAHLESINPRRKEIYLKLIAGGMKRIDAKRIAKQSEVI